MRPILGAMASARFVVVHANSVKGRWEKKWNHCADVKVPGKVPVLQATEALQAHILSHGLWIYF